MAKGLQLFAQRRQRIAVAGSRRVGRNVERRADLLEGELLPDLEDEHLALIRRQPLEGDLDLDAPLISLAGQFFKFGVLMFDSAIGLFLASRAAVFAPGQVQRGTAD
jgi:hypothetical protein